MRLIYKNLPRFALFRLRSSDPYWSDRRTGWGVGVLQSESSPRPAWRGETPDDGSPRRNGQECVSDYVQSTTNALKGPMFLQAADAFQNLRTLRPDDRSSRQSNNSARRGPKSLGANSRRQSIVSTGPLRSIRVRVLLQCAWSCAEQPESVEGGAFGIRYGRQIDACLGVSPAAGRSATDCGR